MFDFFKIPIRKLKNMDSTKATREEVAKTIVDLLMGKLRSEKYLKENECESYKELSVLEEFCLVELGICLKKYFKDWNNDYRDTNKLSRKQFRESVADALAKACIASYKAANLSVSCDDVDGIVSARAKMVNKVGTAQSRHKHEL